MIKQVVIRLIQGNEKNIPRDCFIWNTFAGLVNAAEAVVMMMIITRIDGVTAAGVLSIAFAVGNLFMTIGKYGVRNYQATDIDNRHTFNSYLTMRIITTAMMFIVSTVYVLWKNFYGKYSVEKAGVVFLICCIYMVECIEDVFLGHYQKEGRLDISSKIFVIRWMLILMIFCICMSAGVELFLSLLVSFLISTVVELCVLVCTKTLFKLPELRIEIKEVRNIFRNCTALFLAAFLTYYVTNAPKYAIDAILSEEMQAYYGYISMPVFVVELLNCFLYQPKMVLMAQDWNQNKVKELNRKIGNQIIEIIILTCLCVLGTYLFGVQALSILYGVNLSDYREELILLMLAGGGLAFVGYTSVVLTIMRKQNALLCNMILVSIAALFGFKIFVKKWGILGAILYYLLLMIALAVENGSVICITEWKYKNKEVCKE